MKSWLSKLIKEVDLTPDDIKKLKQVQPKVTGRALQNRVLTVLKPRSAKDSSLNLKKVQRIMSKHTKRKPVRHGLAIKSKE